MQGSEVISFYFPSFFHFQLVLMIFLNGKYHSPITLLKSNSCLLGKLIVLSFSKVIMKNIRKIKNILLNILYIFNLQLNSVIVLKKKNTNNFWDVYIQQINISI